MNVNKNIRAQEYKGTRILLFCLLLTCIFFCQVSANTKNADLKESSALQIYLPREVAIKDSTIKLGQVSIIRGEASLVAKAGEIALGQISMPGQKIIIDRPIVLNRLTCNGIPASQVELSGAEKITIKRQEQVIKGSEFIELASEFLKENLPAGSICQLDPLQIPKDFTIPKQGKDVKFVPHLAKSSSANLAKVQIVALQDGKQIEVSEVMFRLKYNCRQAVTLVDIPAGATISPENIKIENTVSNYPEPDQWMPPYGLTAKRRLPANNVLQPYMLSQAKSEIIIKRNQNIMIRIESSGLLVTATGKAIQDGRAGEYVKVRNIDSQRIILARVDEDGTVEPVL